MHCSIAEAEKKLQQKKKSGRDVINAQVQGTNWSYFYLSLRYIVSQLRTNCSSFVVVELLRFHMHTTLVIDCNQKSSAGIINAIVYAVAYYIRLAVVQSECGMLRLTIQHMATNKHNGSLFLLGLHRYQSIVNMLGRCLLSMSFSFPSLVVLCIIANLRGKDVQNQRTTSFEQNYPSVIWLIALELLLSVTPIFQSIFLLMPFVKRYL